MPAHNLAIDALDTVDVSQSDLDQVRTFTSLADDAVLNVADIQAAFDAGFSVVMSTGEDGGSTGNIVWRTGTDVTFFGFEDPYFLWLTFETDPLDTGRNVDIQASLIGSPADNSPFRGLSINTGGTQGAVTLHQVDVAGGWISVTAGAAGIFLHDNLSTHGGDLTLSGNVLLEESVTLNTNLDDPSFIFGGGVLVSGTIDGNGAAKDLSILARNNTISLESDLGGVQHQLGNLSISGELFLAADRVIDVQTQFTLANGTIDLGSHELTVSTGTFSIGDGIADGHATLAGSGVVHADTTIQVASDGVVSPGGVRNIGTLEIDGSIQFQGASKLVVDLDATPDNLHATGAVQLDAGALLFGGSGVLSGPGPFAVLTTDSGLTGTFANTQTTIGLADDLVTVAYTNDAVLLEPATLTNGKQVTGLTSDGTVYTIKLKGGGNAQLQVFESFRLGSVLAVVTEARQVTEKVLVEVPVNIVVKTTTVLYETVPVDTGASIVYVTIPVLREVDTEVTAIRSEERPRTKTVFAQVQVQKDDFVRSLDIRVSNSTRANELVITANPNGGFGRLEIGSILVSGALGGLIAPTTTLSGLQVDGYLGELRLAHLLGPALSGGDSGQKTSIDIPWIEGDITTGSAISSLTSHQVDDVTITAPRIGKLVTTASPQRNLTGDFNADLVLDAVFRSTLALGSASIAGGISSSIWYIRGSVGTVTVNETIEHWSLGDEFGPAFTDSRALGNVHSLNLNDVHESSIWSSGKIGKLSAASWDGFVIEAETIGSLEVAGNFSVSLHLDAGLSTARALGSATLGSVAGLWDIRGALGAITVAQSVDGWELGWTGGLGAIEALHLGTVTGLSIYASGHIGTLEGEFATFDRDATIQARSIGVLNVTGDFTGRLVLDAGAETNVALQSAHLESIHDSVWDIRGSLGTVTVDNSASQWLLGVSEEFQGQHVDQLGNLGKLSIGGLLHDSAIQVVGRIGSLEATQWQVSDVTARSLGKLRITGAAGDGLFGDFLFSTVTLTGARKRLGLGDVDIAGRVFGSTFNVLAGNVRSFTCGRFEQSGLFVGYDADTSQFLDTWKLRAFTTTSTPVVAQQSDPRSDGFQASRIVAHRFGRIRLSGVFISNGGSTFGLQVNGAANAGRVRIDTAPFAFGVNIQPGTIEGDFAFVV